jgi:hypothetical protein
MASGLDAPPHWIFAGPVGLFYAVVDNLVDYDWCFAGQVVFWFLMLALMLKLLDASFS